MYDWGRPRELHVQKSLASLKNNKLLKTGPFPGKFECEYFSLELFKENTFSASKLTLLYLLEGQNVELCGSDGTKIQMSQEDIVVVFPDETVSITENAKFMKIC